MRWGRAAGAERDGFSDENTPVVLEENEHQSIVEMVEIWWADWWDTFDADNWVLPEIVVPEGVAATITREDDEER